MLVAVSETRSIEGKPMATDAPLLYYDKATGQWETALVDRNGKYQKKTTSQQSNKFGSWTHIVGSGAGTVLFYNKTNRQYATGVLGMDGSFNTNQVSDPGAFHPWTHITAAGRRNHGWSDSANASEQPYLFYNKDNGEWASGVMTPEAIYDHRHTGQNKLAQWSHIVGAGNGALLFYDKDSTKFVTGVLSADASTYEVVKIGNFNPWSHIVGNSNGSLLFYNKDNRQWATGRLSPDGEYTHVHTSDVDGFSTWTNIVNCGNGCLLFYNVATGKFATGILRLDGSFTTLFVSNSGEFGPWTHVAGEVHRSRTVLNLIKLYCTKTEDKGVDHAVLWHDGMKIWGPAEIDDSQELPVNKTRMMRASTMTISLTEEDDHPDSDDNLGKITVPEAERGTGQHFDQFFGDHTNYTLYYEVR